MSARKPISSAEVEARLIKDEMRRKQQAEEKRRRDEEDYNKYLDSYINEINAIMSTEMSTFPFVWKCWKDFGSNKRALDQVVALYSVDYDVNMDIKVEFDLSMGRMECFVMTINRKTQNKQGGANQVD